jgi:hypothetical protein
MKLEKLRKERENLACVLERTWEEMDYEDSKGTIVHRKSLRTVQNLGRTSLRAKMCTGAGHSLVVECLPHTHEAGLHPRTAKRERKSSSPLDIAEAISLQQWPGELLFSMGLPLTGMMQPLSSTLESGLTLNPACPIACSRDDVIYLPNASLRLPSVPSRSPVQSPGEGKPPS